MARGRPVLALLREALKNSELEVVRRAQRCIQRIEEEPAHRLPGAALRLLALRKPAKAAETLLAYLPFAEDETLPEAQSALNLLALHDGKPDPALLRALANVRPKVRAAAAEALAHAKGPEARPTIRKLLGDADLTVRLRVALALAPRDAQAIPVLIRLIADLQDDQARQVHDFLAPLAGEKAPPHPDDNAEARKKSSAAWAAWWKDNAAKADLAKLTNPHQQFLGHTVIAEYGTGRIVELGRDRKPRWSFAGTQNPVDAWLLPNNRVLVAEYSGPKVSMRDLKGTILWQKQVTGQPHNVQPLPNGHTFIATNVQLLEVDRTGKEVFTLNQGQLNVGGFTGGYRAKNGHIICMGQNGQCVRLDAKGKQLKSFNTGLNNAWMDLLANGHILIATNGSNKIAEYNPDGKLILELDVPQVSMATGLPNGNILAASNATGRVIEMDRRGRIIWEFKTQGPFRARGR